MHLKNMNKGQPPMALHSQKFNINPSVISKVMMGGSSPNRIIKSRRMRWAWHVARMGAKRNAYRILVGKPEGKRPLRRPRHRWVDNIKIDLR
jgi:hypothetical protein